MSYEKWLSCIIEAARNIASQEFQEEAWFPGGRMVSSPDEVYQVLMEDCTADLFFETHGETLTREQREAWRELRRRLESYYEQMPKTPDARRVLNDPEWGLVRQSAPRFVQIAKS